MKWTVAKQNGQWWAHSPGCSRPVMAIVCVLFHGCVNVERWEQAFGYAQFKAAERRR